MPMSEQDQATPNVHTPRPAERQMTWRAILAGCLLGGVASCMNTWMGLEIGGSFGGSLIADVMGFRLFASWMDP